MAVLSNIPCEGCGSPIPLMRARRRARFCSGNCMSKWQVAEFRKRNNRGGVPIASGTVGAISELRVSVDLMAKGYPVFRALSPACPVDLAVLHGERLLRIEVTTGYLGPKGQILFNSAKRRWLGVKYDHLAVPVRGEVHYLPDLPPRDREGT